MPDTNRRANLHQTQFLYRRKFRWWKRCVYCGDIATQWDHVLSLAYVANLNAVVDWRHPGARHEMRQGFCMVPACAECNRLAGATPFVWIREKRDFIQRKLKKKYDHVLEAETWSDKEIRELGPTLRSHVRNQEWEQKVLNLRIQWPDIRWAA